jgi:hypothetical protein
MKSYKQTILNFSTAIVLALMAVPATGDETDEAIQNIILSQIEAFANDDKDGAWAFASDGIKLQSGSADIFYDMVKLSYGPVYQASSLEFRERIPHPGFQVQVVRLIGPDGKRWRAVYRMVMNEDQWRIGGVVLKQAPGTI